MIYKFKVVYKKLGIGTAPSSAPVCTVVDSSDNVLINAQAAIALTNLTGVYLYSYTGAAGLDLVGLFHTTDATMDYQDLYSYTSDLITTNVDAKISTRATLGVGAVEWIYNVKNNLGANLADVTVWVSDGIGGTNILASGLTDAYGNITFYLDAGTVYVWCHKSGINFSNPDTEVVA